MICGRDAIARSREAQTFTAAGDVPISGRCSLYRTQRGPPVSSMSTGVNTS